MLDAWLWIPLPMRLLLLVLTGFALGSFVNLAVYSFVFHPRPVTPWERVRGPLDLSPHSVDLLLVLGWLFLRREAQHFGRFFWIRPLLIELSCGIGLAALYW